MNRLERTAMNRGAHQVPLSKEQENWIRRACAQINEQEIAELNRKMASIPSPTGEEAELARAMTEYMNGVGIPAFYQPIDETQGNAVAHVRGSDGGVSLLLYAPIDTAFSGRAEEDCPWVGNAVPREMTTEAYIQDGDVVGMGAENPKGYAACLVMAARAVHEAGVPLRGDLLVGLGSGGMPTNKRPAVKRFNTGQGTGCAFMLEQGVRGDFAIIAKPGYAVSWEEVGLCWFKIQVKGALGYTGVRHVVSGRNPIVDAAKIVTALEEWFPKYTKRNTSGLVAPQGSINAIESGWTYKPAFIPARCDLYVDLRISPRTDPMEAKRQFGEALTEVRKAHPEVELDWDMIVSIPGSTTDADNWIVQSCIRAWEHVEGKKHTPRIGTSGATDANILRAWGIPTARLGIPRLKDSSAGRNRSFSMEVSNIAGMKQLTKCIVYAIVDTCTRSRRDVGLQG
jgi:acetylornithine deacetylase/succinyl-diaminopimelate desuccinylase-like protein